MIFEWNRLKPNPIQINMNGINANFIHELPPALAGGQKIIFYFIGFSQIMY